MLCRITDMHDKEVINVCDGTRLGCVDDVEVDTCTAQLVAIVIHGRPKCMGFMGHEEDLVIGWKEIEVIGEQTILVNHPTPPEQCVARRKGTSIISIDFYRIIICTCLHVRMFGIRYRNFRNLYWNNRG